jgi:MYXO-CTERM domain-containing protein
MEADVAAVGAGSFGEDYGAASGDGDLFDCMWGFLGLLEEEGEIVTVGARGGRRFAGGSGFEVEEKGSFSCACRAEEEATGWLWGAGLGLLWLWYVDVGGVRAKAEEAVAEHCTDWRIELRAESGRRSMTWERG